MDCLTFYKWEYKRMGVLTHGSATHGGHVSDVMLYTAS